MESECCQDDSVNCSCFRKDKNETQGLFDPCAVCANTGQTAHCTTELYVSVDKLKNKKTNKQQGKQRQGRDGVSVQMSMSM